MAASPEKPSHHASQMFSFLIAPMVPTPNQARIQSDPYVKQVQLIMIQTGNSVSP
jgi:hypothetical protein